MATNNLLVNNEQKVLYEQRSKIERSGHNLSQSRKFPCRVGYIYPFFCRKTLPSDSFKIWSNILVKQLQPLLVPQMVSFTVNTAFYWVDYSLAFPEFEYFLINQRGQQNIELPYISEQPSNAQLSQINANDLGTNIRTFLGFSANNINNEKIDALPFWSYQTIIRDFYTNIDRLSETEYNKLFPSTISDWNLKQGCNNKIGNDIDPFKIGVHNVRGDYFVNSYPTPLRGDVPSITQNVAVSNFLADVDFDQDLNFGSLDGKQLDFRTSSMADISNGEHDGVFVKMPDLNFLTLDIKAETPSSIQNTPAISDLTNENSIWNTIQTNFGIVRNSFNNVNSNVSFSNVRNFTTNLNFTVRQLRLLESLTRKREIDIMMKPRLKNYLNTYFGINNYKNDSLYQPIFIGSTTQQILINDIEQTTATSDSPLGRQGATAISLGNNYVGEYYCRNYGCLMGLMYILPDYDYEPAIPREWQERTPDDFFNPEFAHLSMQPILNKELFVSGDTPWNNEVLGYMGMYDNYRTSVNLVAGEFLNDNMQDIQQFAQVRRFNDGNKPEITTSFLNSNTAFDSSVFSVPTLPPFIAQCVARIEAVRPIPEIAIPRG